MAPLDSRTMKSTKRILTTAASLAASAMLVRTVVNEFLPYEVRDYIFSGINNFFFTRFSTQLTIVIDEMDGYSTNQIYDASKTYLGTKISPLTRRLKVSKREDKSFEITLEGGEEMIDSFEGIEFKWQLVCREIQHAGSNNRNYSQESTEVRSLELSFHNKHRDKVFSAYLPYILDLSKAIKEGDKRLNLYTNEGDSWFNVPLNHPSTFDTLAMDSELKEMVMEDLARFVKRKDYYKRVGKAWKRGYLLYGPPGTGKSSLIVAMANFLKFDIYDLELTEVQYNSTLRRLLVATENRSILVVEDIDCSIELKNRDAEERGSQDKQSLEEKVTLSGLLNFVDGLWSSCGDERIIVFATNYKDRIDPALLRPGRMDMHIHMTYCSPNGFKVLASNYHAIDDHPLYEEIEGLIGEVKVTPAEVAEELMKSDGTEKALGGLIKFLQGKREEASDQANTKGVGVEGLVEKDQVVVEEG